MVGKFNLEIIYRYRLPLQLHVTPNDFKIIHIHFSNSHISGKGRRLGQGGASNPINSHAIQNSLSGSHQQRKRRRRQRKAAAAAAAERNKSELINNSENLITINQCRQMNNCGKSGSNDKNQGITSVIL